MTNRRISIILMALSLIVLSFMPQIQASYTTNPCTPPHGHLTFEGFCWPEDRLPFILALNATSGNDNSVGTLRFGLYENGTIDAVPAVTYDIKITEAGSNEPLLRDTFHVKNGTLVLRLTHSEGATLVRAYQEPILGAWMAADNATEPITISSREISRDGMFNIQVEILGFDNIRNLAPPDQIAKADFVWNPASDTADTVTIVPEFGSIATVAITTMTVGIAVAASRFRLKSFDSLSHQA